MSGFQFAASLVASLAWPIVVLATLAVVWFKRGDIASLIGTNGPIAGGRKIRRVKAGPIELEWDQLIQSAADQVMRAVPLTPAAEGSQSGSRAGALPGGGGITSEAIRPTLSSVPAAAVLEEFARVESRLRALLDRAGKPSSASDDVGTLTRQAFQMGLISKELLSAIDDLAKLRDEAAHRVGRAEITASQARQYVDLAERVMLGLGVSTEGSDDKFADTDIW